MDQEFKPISARACALSAGIALLATAGIVGSVLALAGHYDDQFLQMVKAQHAGSTRHAATPSPTPTPAAG